MTRNPGKWLLPVAAVIVLLSMIAWMAGGFRARVEPGQRTPVPVAAAGGVEFTVEPVDVAITEAVPATIGARQATTISSRILARITRIHVRAGDSVIQGQPLLDLERSELESRRSQAEELVRSMRARLTEARQSLERTRNLQAQGLVARAALDEAQARHDSLTAELAAAQRAVDEAETALGYTEIHSPIDGRVIDRFAEPGDTAAPGERLLSLYNPLSLRVEAAVRESIALPLRVGQNIDVEIPALGRRLAAQIEELVPAADPGSRSFLVKARVELQDDLLPGMYARMRVPAGSERLLLVPAGYVVGHGQLSVAWVVVEGHLERRFLRIGRAFEGDRVEVLSGLEAGDVLALPPVGAADSAPPAPGSA